MRTDDYCLATWISGLGQYEIQCERFGKSEYWGTFPDECPSCHKRIILDPTRGWNIPPKTATTNDEQASYGRAGKLFKADMDSVTEDDMERAATRLLADKPTERAPMLSDEHLVELLGDDWVAMKGDRAESAARKVINFYESLITKGVLVVRK